MRDDRGDPAERPDWRALGTEAGLDEATLRSACRRRRYARGVTIFHEGDPGGAFHMIDRGHVAVRLTTLSGEESIIDVLQPGDTFGEQALIETTRDRSASVTAIDTVETLTLDVGGFRTLRDTHAAVDRFLLIVLSNRLRATSAQLLEARHLGAETRLFRCLYRLADQFDAMANGAIPLRQSDIAGMVGMTRPTANRLLRRAAQDGVIALGRSRLRIMDPNELRRRAELR